MPDRRMTLFKLLDDRTPLTGRLAMGIEYDGSAYCGYQFLKHSPSVQAALEKALARVASQPIRVHASGRTDSGVHAGGQPADSRSCQWAHRLRRACYPPDHPL